MTWPWRCRPFQLPTQYLHSEHSKKYLTYEPGVRPVARHESLCSSVIGAFDRCTGAHGFYSNSFH